MNLIKPTILIIEDEKNISNFISTALLGQDYRVLQSFTGVDGMSVITSQCPDLILLDLGLPDMDGLDIIRQVRDWSAVPILVISARTQELEKVTALDLGADDYLVKPFGTSELLARIRTARRHYSSGLANSRQRTYQTGQLSIDFEKYLVTVNNQEIHLTQIEFKIISLLAKNAGHVMTYDSIMKNVWGPYIGVNNRILRVNMANIRRKLEENPADPEYILTEIGIGYRMVEDHE